MGKTWKGVSYDEDWHEELPGGGVSADKDWQANAEYAAANNTQNPYTNEAGASPFDQSGMVPGNESGSTLPPVAGVASQTPAYAKWNLYKSPQSAAPWQTLLGQPSNGAGAPSNNPIVGIEPWLMNPVAGGSSGGQSSIEQWLASLAPSSASMLFQEALNQPQASDVGEPEYDRNVVLQSSEGPRRRSMTADPEGDRSIDVSGGGLDALLALLAQGAVPSALR